MIEEEENVRLLTDQLYVGSSGSLESVLFINNCDPFAVRGSYLDTKANNEKLIEKEDFEHCGRVFGSYFDKLRRKWNKLILVLIAYLCAKSLSVMLFRELISSTKLNGHQNVHYYLERFSWLVGDPYSSIPIASLMACLANPISCLTARCVPAYEFANGQPLESSFVRFVLDPKREMHRIDREAGEQIDEAIKALEKYRSDLSDVIQLYQRFESTLSNHRDPTVQSTIAGWQASWVRAKHQSSWLKLLRAQTNIIRPKTFTYDGHRRSFLISLMYIWLFVVGTFILTLYLEFVANYFNWTVRCEEHSMRSNHHPMRKQTNDSSVCDLMDTFTLPELLTMLEINLLICVNNSLTYIVLVGIFGLQTYHQLNLTASASNGLDRLLCELRRFNLQPGGQLEGKQGEQLSKIDCLLYTNIISLFMHDRESQESSRLISRLIRLAVANVLIFTLVTFSTLGSSTKTFQESQASRQIQSKLTIIRSIGSLELDFDTNIAVLFWLAIWLTANLACLTCASIPSSVIRMKQTVPSIMAEICRLQSAMRPCEQHLSKRLTSRRVYAAQCHLGDLSENDPLARLWRKFVLSHNFAHEHHTAVLFKLKMTYKNIIELNLLVATLVSLLVLRTANSKRQYLVL